jgi:hypothetical protein
MRQSFFLPSSRTSRLPFGNAQARDRTAAHVHAPKASVCAIAGQIAVADLSGLRYAKETALECC